DPFRVVPGRRGREADPGSLDTEEVGSAWVEFPRASSRLAGLRWVYAGYLRGEQGWGSLCREVAACASPYLESQWGRNGRARAFACMRVASLKEWKKRGAVPHVTARCRLRLLL